MAEKVPHCRSLGRGGPGLLLVASAAAALCALGGCGQRRPLAPVTGRVLYEGEPLRFGSVMFQPETGQPATALIQPDGTFTLSTVGEGAGAALGRNRVRITCYEGQRPDRGPSGGAGESGLGRLLIPRKYAGYETSGLTVDVRAEGNEPFVFDLHDDSASRDKRPIAPPRR
jgi:hypothetical protein